MSSPHDPRLPDSPPATSPVPEAGWHPDVPVIGPLTGSWTWDVELDHLTWSDEMYVIHGVAPGDVAPTRELMQAHKHLEDLDRCRGVLAHALEHGGVFACPHRIIDAHMRTRHVLQVGSARADAAGTVIEMTGFMVDLTETRRDVLRSRAPEGNGAVPELVADRAVVTAEVPQPAWRGEEHGLSQRESEILTLVVRGLRNDEIAETAYLSINTVKTYVRTLYRKIEATSRSQAVRWGMRHGFDSAEESQR